MSLLLIKTVVVPFDFSEQSEHAIDVALEMVESASQLHIIHVIANIAATEPGVVWETVSDLQRREQAENVMRERFSGDRYRGLNFNVAFGNPGIAITSFAETIKAQLIVIPSHGRTGLKRLLIGSVAERVCRLAHCPVLVLRQ